MIGFAEGRIQTAANDAEVCNCKNLGPGKAFLSTVMHQQQIRGSGEYLMAWFTEARASSFKQVDRSFVCSVFATELVVQTE